MSATPIQSPSSSRRFRWYHLYYLLAGFDLLTIACSLLLSNSILGIYTESLDVNQAWAKRIEGYAELRELAANVNAPGNNVFDSRDIDGESAKLELAVEQFTAKLGESRTEIEQFVPEELATPLLAHFVRIQAPLDSMAGEARKIFDFFRRDLPAKAGERMNSMDQRFYDVNGAIARLEADIRKIQFENFAKQNAKASDLSRYEFLVAGAILVIIAFVTIYGHKVSKAMLAAEQLQQKQLADLQEGEARLREAKQVAESASEAKSNFLANMSHEIRTPMTAILGYTDNLLESDVTDEQREDALRTIQRNGNHLLQLLNDILDLSKIEANRLEVESVRTSPVELLGEVLTLMRGRAEAKSLEFELDVETDLPRSIQSDPTRLRQTLINIVGNAIKFTQSGSVTVGVRFDSSAQSPIERDALTVRVQDTGIGMTPEQLASVFDPFSQADATTTRRFGGTGLGLAICRRLVDALGGCLTAESEIGRGSDFTIVIPTGDIRDVEWSRGEEITSRASTPVETKAPPEKCGRFSGHILLAEDGPDNQRLIGHILRKGGAKVTVVNNGQEAVDYVSSPPDDADPIDLVIMDMQMPVLDGYGATRTLRANGCTLPIVALTANAMSHDRAKCLDAGCDEFATKPIDRAALLELVQTILSRETA